MQATLEQETKAKAELLRLKKKLEADISVSYQYCFDLSWQQHLGWKSCFKVCLPYKDHPLRNKLAVVAPTDQRSFHTFKFFKELEIALDHANRANEDAQRNVKRYGDQVSLILQTL